MTNEKAMKVKAPNGYWSAHTLDDEHWEVRYSTDTMIFRWEVDTTSWKIEFVEE
jgi:hypothetical protein